MDYYDIWKMIVMQVGILYFAIQLCMDHFVRGGDDDDDD